MNLFNAQQSCEPATALEVTAAVRSGSGTAAVAAAAAAAAWLEFDFTCISKYFGCPEGCCS